VEQVSRITGNPGKSADGETAAAGLVVARKRGNARGAEEPWGKLLGDTAAVTALLDRLLHHAHVLKCGPKSWRTKVHTDLRTEDTSK
jgi:hypothetical protein